MFHLGHIEAEEEARCRNAPEIWRLSGAYSMSFPIILSCMSSPCRTTTRSGGARMAGSESEMVVVGERELKVRTAIITLFLTLDVETTFPGFSLSPLRHRRGRLR